ncbi:MAG: flagellar basal body P-ring protein FlgI [Pirellulales bacterium]
MKRREFLLLSSATIQLGVWGCTSPILRPQSPEASLEEVTQSETDYASKFTQPHGLNYVQIEAVSLATGLAGSGEDPPATPQRAALLAEMAKNNVERPNEILASLDTALILVRGYLRPGIKQGERFDVEVRVPARSETTSLRGGWVLPARMTEMAVLDSQIRQGHVLGMAEGPILVDPSAKGETDTALSTRGRILGGGVATKSRPLGLIISREYKSIRLSQDIAKCVNDRFHTFRNGRKEGVAVPKTDEFVELQIDDRYKENVGRFMRIIRHLAVNELPARRQARIQLLGQQLLDPLTAATAAMRLEAIGDSQAIEVLKTGVASSDPEVRFYSAEALAYLDETTAVKPLAEAARDEPAFRVNALAALSVMDDVVAYDELRSLLEVTSAETRYGAFRSLWSMNANDALIRGEMLGGQFSYHILDIAGPQMVHVTRSFRPEIVLFGADQQLKLPLVLDAGKNILVNGMSGEQVTISRFMPGMPPEKRVVSTSVDEVIRTIVELGGAYPDVVQALQQAKTDGALTSRFRIDALPDVGRDYDRSDSTLADEKSDEEPESGGNYRVGTPLPDLFSAKR